MQIHEQTGTNILSYNKNFFPQVINAKTLSNEAKNRSIIQKIALQMNCKLGGTLWSIKIPFNNVMICGVDTFHEAGNRGNSVAGKAF